MKFDCILANPPYQKSASNGGKKTQPIWQLFVEKSLSVLKDGGHMGMIHPDGWRNVDGMFKDTQKLILDNTVEYLEMNDEVKGNKIFGATTTYDVYCLKKELNALKKTTTIKLDDGSIVQKYINDMEFIPNGMFDEFAKLVAKSGEEKVQIIADSSYHTQRDHMSKEQTDEFKYPCVYTCQKDDTINFWYSSTNQNGHFGTSKVFWSNGAAASVHCDYDGRYGLTQFAYAIVDNVENLDNIKQAMESEKFIKLMAYADGQVGKYSRKVISTFRKDFWKEFI